METDHLSGSSISNIDQVELLKSAKAKMGEVREENERLKKLLTQVAMDYKSLEKQISLIAQSTTKTKSRDNNHKEDDHGHPDLVSLTLGSWTSNKKCEDDHTKNRHASDDVSNKRRKIDGGLELGLDNYCKLEHYTDDSLKNSTLDSNENEESKEEENIETWSPSREMIKSKEKTSSREDDQESLHQPQVKKTRVCIRSRCDTPTMNDGCQWRKYGQKIAKGNPCPRAYYRCTVSTSCPVRKQVQRCADDMSILITTYEGTHNHPLALSATAMASATTAAAAMLKTGSLTSQHTLGAPTNHPNISTTSSFGLHSSTLMNPFHTNARLSIPNPSMISASSHSHPTITLDLTTPNNSGLAPFNNWLSSSSSFNTSSRKASSLLNFSSSSPCSTSLDFTSSAPPTSTAWASGYFNYGTPSYNTFNNNNNNNMNHMNTRHIYQNTSDHSQQSLNETIAAVATKAIASNPNFQSVLAAAISSYVGNNKASSDQKKSPSPTSNSQPHGNNGSLMLFPTSSSLPTSNNNVSPGTDTRDR